MSVSLALIPIALTLRVVMGKDKFSNWVETMQVKVPTNFETELDLIQTLRKAGYDAEKFGGNIKTYINREKKFFYWEFADGKWHAIFSKSDDPYELNSFMKDLEQKSFRKIFTDELHHTAEHKQDSVQVFSTNFRDRSILIRTLKEFGVNPVQRNNNDITCTVQGTKLTFRQQGDAPFSVEIHKTPNLSEIYTYISDIDDEYKRCVQALVYEKLKQKAFEKNLSIETEEVLEDNSIVITLNIQG